MKEYGNDFFIIRLLWINYKNWWKLKYILIPSLVCKCNFNERLFGGGGFCLNEEGIHEHVKYCFLWYFRKNIFKLTSKKDHLFIKIYYFYYFLFIRYFKFTKWLRRVVFILSYINYNHITNCYINWYRSPPSPAKKSL